MEAALHGGPVRPVGGGCLLAQLGGRGEQAGPLQERSQPPEARRGGGAVGRQERQQTSRGLEVVRRLVDIDPTTKVVILTGYGSIATALEAAHGQGIIHRDLKPGNVFYENGYVKIGDYGLSKFISCSRRSGQTESVGTFHYMAPEIGLGRYGKEIDIYALGILLFEMLTGERTFRGETVSDTLAAVDVESGR